MLKQLSQFCSSQKNEQILKNKEDMLILRKTLVEFVYFVYQTKVIHAFHFIIQ